MHLYSGSAAGLDLFAPTAEDEWISALEADHGTSLSGVLDQQTVDLRLRIGCVSRSFPDIDQLGSGPRFRKELGSDQAIVHDDIGPAEELEPAYGNEAGIARTAPNQVDDARPSLWKAATRTKPRCRRRWVTPGQIDDDLDQSRISPDRLVHSHAASRVSLTKKPWNVFYDVGPAADEERHDDQIGQCGLLEQG
jgi:hypothetical protein